MGIGDERSFPQINSVHFTLTTKESTIPSRGVNQCMKSSCKRKNKFLSLGAVGWHQIKSLSNIDGDGYENVS